MLILRYKFGNYDLKDAASSRCLSKLLTIYPSKISIYQKSKIERGMVSVRFFGIHCITQACYEDFKSTNCIAFKNRISE